MQHEPEVKNDLVKVLTPFLQKSKELVIQQIATTCMAETNALVSKLCSITSLIDIRTVFNVYALEEFAQWTRQQLSEIVLKKKPLDKELIANILKLQILTFKQTVESMLSKGTENLDQQEVKLCSSYAFGNLDFLMELFDSFEES